MLLKKLENIISLVRAMHLLCNKAYIQGCWAAAQDIKEYPVIDPATGKTIGSVPDMNSDDVRIAICAARDAWKLWRCKTAKERSDLLQCFYYSLMNNSESLATIILAETGKPMTEARNEVALGNSYVKWFSEEARRVNGEIIASPYASTKLFVEREPIGVAAFLTPWNYPYACLTKKVCAALAAGCSCVIKPNEKTPFSALAFAKMSMEARFPTGLINVVTANKTNSLNIAKDICKNRLVAAVSFTGSMKTGKALYAECASTIKKLSLQLNGNTPFIVFQSADICKAVSDAVAAKFTNCGQSNIAVNRFLVHECLYDEFVCRLDGVVSTLCMGQGCNPAVNLGPLTTEAQFKKTIAFVEDAVKKGGCVLRGGKPCPTHGPWFYEPTILGSINGNMDVYNKVIFGPIAPVLSFACEDEALCLANTTRGGQAGFIYSRDVRQIFRVSRQLDCGMIGVNENAINTAEIPFGGMNQAGIGREGCHHGVDEFLSYKYMCLGNLK